MAKLKELCSRVGANFLWLAVLPVSAHAENLLDVYQQARENDPVYQAGFHQHEASREVYEQARALLLPNVKFDISRTDTTQDIVSSDNQVFSQGSTSYPTDEMSLSITQSVYSFANWANFKKSKEDVKRVAAELEDVRQDLVMRVAEAYFTALKERDSYLAIRAEVTALEKHYELVQNQRAEGLARMTDLLDSQARYMQAQAREVEISNDLRDAIQGLQELTGTLPESLVSLGDVLELVSPEPMMVDAWVESAQRQNPMLLAKQNALAVAWQEVRRQKGGHYPTLDLVVTQQTRETQGSLFGGGSEVDTQDILLKFTLPIYSGGAVSSKVRETINLHNKAKDELEQEWRKAGRETRAAFSGVAGAITKVNALQRSVDAYELAVDAKRTSFESGLISSVSVLDAERDLFIARSDFSAARYEYLLNTLRLKRAAGTLNVQDLEQINAELQGADVTTDVDAMMAAENAAALNAPVRQAESFAANNLQADVRVRSVVFQDVNSSAESDDQQLANVKPATSVSVTTDTAPASLTTSSSFSNTPVDTEQDMQADGWLNQLPADAFVVQLAKGGNEVAIQRFIRKHGLDSQAAYYRTERDSGQIVFVLITSPFKTVAAAKEAVAEMPAAVRKGIWIRNVSTLQGMYRQPGAEA
ncbi:TolC family outer membrane protein [Aliamphritea ceti]|uniref:TolC family outer membrane protein n=1 Tax=Aliamphritea ceti TaxID=1524258 RepID=UPI0021C29EA1|nr:TolC family outer membrane protein [Aliamphritea ceti]